MSLESKSSAKVPERPTVLIWMASECLYPGQLKLILSLLVLKYSLENGSKCCLCEISSS